MIALSGGLLLPRKDGNWRGSAPRCMQVVCLRDFARVFYDVVDAGLSEDVLRWMCERGKEGAGKTLSETLKTLFFPEGEVAKRVLRVFDRCKGAEREAVLWLVKHVASKGSYLECVARQEGFLSATSAPHTSRARRIAWMNRWCMLANAGMLYGKRTLECPTRTSGSSSRDARANPRRELRHG